jgi:RNA polymerase sigma-70 factor (ECF subfamily)
VEVGAQMAVLVEELYRKYAPMVWRRCRSLLRDDDEALDAMQDTFVRVLKNQAGLDARAPSSLLFRIATNVCLNRLRTKRRRPASSDEALLAQIALASGESAYESRALLARLFNREPASSGVIAVLHLVDGMTLEQVAREVGLSVSGVRKRLRALEARLLLIAEEA